MDIPEQIRKARALHASTFRIKHDKDEIRAFHAKHRSYKMIREKFGITSNGTIHYIINGRKKKG